tara:strand:+ start:4393 stop:4593 length:201 start_codon:yes stop_codon:yes gene_type:complete
LNNALLLSEIREYLGKGASLYRSLLKKGVSPEVARSIMPLANVGQEDDPFSEISTITEALLEEGND